MGELVNVYDVITAVEHNEEIPGSAAEKLIEDVKKIDRASDVHDFVVYQLMAAESMLDVDPETMAKVAAFITKTENVFLTGEK